MSGDRSALANIRSDLGNIRPDLAALGLDLEELHEKKSAEGLSGVSGRAHPRMEDLLCCDVVGVHEVVIEVF